MSTPSTTSGPRPGPEVILLHGPSSAGKTTIGRALQARLAEPFLCVSFDDFVFAHAPRYYRGADDATPSDTDEWIDQGCRIVTTSAPGEPLAVRAEFGPVFRRTFAAIGPTVRTLVAAGCRVIFDHVIADEWMYASWIAACGDLDVLRVGVTCPIPVLEARERARGDGVAGARVHRLRRHRRLGRGDVRTGARPPKHVEPSGPPEDSTMMPCRLTDGTRPRRRIPFGRLARFVAGLLVAGLTTHATAADVSTSPGRTAVFETRHLADVLMFGVAIDGEIAKGRSGKVLAIDASAKSFIANGPAQVNLGLTAQVNGVTVPVTFSTNSAIGNACSTLGRWIVDLDQAEAANPGGFVGRPIDVHVTATATGGFNRTATSLDLAMTAHMESKR